MSWRDCGVMAGKIWPAWSKPAPCRRVARFGACRLATGSLRAVEATMRDGTEPQPQTERDSAGWDAEIEAEFQRATAAAKATGRKKRGQRLVGCPFAFLADVCRSTEGRAPLVVAILIYRRTCVCNSQTVTLPGVELTELGIDRSMKRKALAQLEAAELVRVERVSGRTATITLLWNPG